MFDPPSLISRKSWFKDSGVAPVFPFPPPFDLSTASLNTGNALTVDAIHCFALALASSAGVIDFVTELNATTSGTITIDSTAAGDAYKSVNPNGFTPATSVADLTDAFTIAVIANTQIFTVQGFFGHLFSQHPAWFLSNQDYTANQPTRMGFEIGGVESSVNFDDGGESGEADVMHVYVATYDGANIKTYQDGALINTVPATGNISSQDASHTRVGSYWGDTSGQLVGSRDQVFAMLLRRVWSAAEVTSFSANPWQVLTP